jgi:hypothetical protein
MESTKNVTASTMFLGMPTDEECTGRVGRGWAVGGVRWAKATLADPP